MLTRAWLVALVGTVALLGLVRSAPAHESSPAVLALKQTATDRFLAVWTPSFPPIEDLVVHLPVPCTINGLPSFDPKLAPVLPTLMDCAGSELVGEVVFTSGQSTLGPIAVNTEWLDGTQSMHLSSGSPSKVVLGGTTGSTGPWQVVRDYVALGLEHILFGIDHLLFVLGLLLLVNGWRTLVTTISAFTLAHSVTLAAATLGLVNVPIAPVEISIALSILLLSIEVAHERDTITRTRPWLVAFGFGLLHGLGFASALSDVGLPRHAVALSLFAFNVGVELGQLGVVALVFLGYRGLRGHAIVIGRVRWAAVGLLATCSVFWLLQRLHGWLMDLGVCSSLPG